MKRNEKWAIKVISEEVKNEFDVRPFPVENMEMTNVVHNSDTNALNSRLLEELKSSLKEIAVAQFSEVQSQYEEIIKKLPDPLRIERKKGKIALRRWWRGDESSTSWNGKHN